MWKSLKECAKTVGKWWWLVVIGFVGGSVRFVQALLTSLPSESEPPHLVIPIWTWAAITLVGLVIAMLIGFHRVRVQRDTAKQELHSQSGRQQLRVLKRSAIETGKKLERAIEATFCTHVTIDGLRAKAKAWTKDAYANMIEYQDPLTDEFGEDAVAQIASLDRVRLRDFVRVHLGYLQDSLVHA